jgi:hypothetical protein
VRLLFALVLAFTASATVRADDELDALVAAYPDHLASHDGRSLTWQDGTRMPASDGNTQKTFAQLLESPSIKDQFAMPYAVSDACGGRI